MTEYPLETQVAPGRHGALQSLDFSLFPEQEAGEPPEARGLRRDQVKLMVSYRRSQAVVHSQFSSLPDFLRPGDVVAINTSGTLKAALKVKRLDGAPLELHLSTHLPANLCVIELRQPAETGALPFYSALRGEILDLPAGGRATLLAPYQGGFAGAPAKTPPRQRLWIASLELPLPWEDYFDRYGFPIRYKYVRAGWPIEYYQNVYSTERGSAEMPSAGRAFTPELITRLVARGVQIAPLILHTGVASLEEDERPYEEYFRVSNAAAGLINHARASGGRVIAVGTTVVRALHTVTEVDGSVHAGEGWTGKVVAADTPLPSIDGLLTGLHEPRSTHLAMLLAIAGYEHVARAYEEALRHGYLWHEFGDLHLILP